MSARLLTGARRVAAVGLAAWGVMIVAGAPRPVVAVVLALLATVPLAVHRRAPLIVLGLVFVGIAGLDPIAGFKGPDDPFVIALLWASYGVGRHEAFRRQPWAAAAVLLFLSMNVVDEDVDLPADLVFPVIFTALPWVAGLSIQLLDGRSRRAESLASEVVGARETELNRATVDERLRLAREIHDVAAHHMTGVALQAQVLRDRLEAGGGVTPGELDGIQRSAREALDELRRVLGVLRPVDSTPDLAPQPSILDLPALVASCRQSGQVVDLTCEGQPVPLPAGLSLTLYRIVQEALSNARRHASGTPVAVQIRWFTDRVIVRTTNEAPATRARYVPGNGVLGMHERAALYGGSIVVGPATSNTWVVDVNVPVAL